jgi:transforming growth factor-beta-induced protein
VYRYCTVFVVFRLLSTNQPSILRSLQMKRLILIPLLLALSLFLAACPAAETPAPTATPVPAAAEPTAEPTEEPMAEPTEEPMAEMNIVETAISAGNFTTLVAAVEAAGLVEALTGEGPFTVFAPTDEAFAALPEGTIDALLADPSGDLTQILLYHVVPGMVMAADVTDGLEAETLQGGTVTFSLADGVTINGVNIVATDIVASNGVIHVIDAVILPPAEEEAAATPEATEEAAEEAAMDEMNIVETAISAGSFTTLVAAVEAAGLVDALSGEGPFTVFAPTDEAFAALPEGTVEALLADPTGDLTQILLYHVVAGMVMAADVTDGLEAETLQGGTVTFSVADGVTINGVNIVATDIVASNGVIHVIDAVILPPTE